MKLLCSYSFKIFYFILFLIVNSNFQVNAQESEPEFPFLYSSSSIRGNYILLNTSEVFDNDTSQYNNTDYFLIERNVLNFKKLNTKFKKIAEVRPVNTMRKLQQYFNNEELENMCSYLGIDNRDSLLIYIQQNSNPENYPYVYLDIRMQLALGHAFLDEDTKKGEIYVYQVYRIDKSGKKHIHGSSVQKTKDQNAGLFTFDAFNNEVHSSDSGVHLSWRLVKNNKEFKPVFTDSLELTGYNDELLVQKLKNLFFRYYVVKNGTLLPTKLILGSWNETEDTMTATVAIDAHPEDEIIAWAVPEDMFGNQGNPSDTSFTFALSYNNAPIILGINVKEVKDGIRLSWEKLPNKSYISGINIKRYDSDDSVVNVATLSKQDTAYIDYEIEVGHQYRYMVSTIFAKGVSFQQDVPAQGVGSYTEFSKPMPPSNLKAENVAENIKLTWKQSETKGLFGYYIYRAYDGKELELIAGPVTELTFVDSSEELSGRSVYSYAILTQNLKQDTSIFSNIVSIQPKRQVEIFPPNVVSLYYSNGKLNISWDDARNQDNYIVGYQVQKRRVEENEFRNFGNTVKYNQLVDSNIIVGINYEYRVASVGSKNELSEFSEPTTWGLAKEEDFSTTSISLRNTHEGVVVSWASIERPKQKNFIVYRRLANEKQFKEIATLSVGNSEYVDTGVEPNKKYVYAVSMSFKDNTEAPMSNAASITCKPQSAPLILK